MLDVGVLKKFVDGCVVEDAVDYEIFEREEVHFYVLRIFFYMSIERKLTVLLKGAHYTAHRASHKKEGAMFLWALK